MLYDAVPKMNKAELISLIDEETSIQSPELFKTADSIRRAQYGDKVFFRGLVELSNFCKKNCYYCGIRQGNGNVQRYRMDETTILDCIDLGYKIGFRSFVLQSGEDGYYTDIRLATIISRIKTAYPDCAITLSLGERSKDSYRTLRNAGADRYLLRHETANKAHYEKLHPHDHLFTMRKQCLQDLKEVGFQVGAGFMVGSPFQTTESLAEDLLFLRELQPHMVGIGPFLPQKDTPFCDYPSGTLAQTLVMIALTRITLPYSLLPSTTALGTLHPSGREQGMNAGANVVMPNLSPTENRKLYALYDNKIATGEETVEGVEKLKKRILSAGFTPDFTRGDHCQFTLPARN